MTTKANPDRTDHYYRARPDEPVFTLRANDPLAPMVVEYWAVLAQDNGERVEKVKSAREVAHDMRKWRRENIE